MILLFLLKSEVHKHQLVLFGKESTAEASVVKIQISESAPGNSISVSEGWGLESVFWNSTLDEPDGNQVCNDCCQVSGQHVAILCHYIVTEARHDLYVILSVTSWNRHHGGSQPKWQTGLSQVFLGIWLMSVLETPLHLPLLSVKYSYAYTFMEFWSWDH